MIKSVSPVGDVRLVPGSSGDLDGVMQVMEAAFDPQFGEAWTRSQCAGILPMSGVALMIARHGESDATLGFSLFRTIGGEAELLLLAVDPAHGRRGIGRKLLDAFMSNARTQGVRRVHLEVRDGNPATGMYLAAGFSPAGRRRNYYRGNNAHQYDALTLARNI